jgi:hypothetical protein
MPRGRALVFVLLAACGGTRPSFDGTLYRQGPVAFRVPPAPAAWRRIDVGDAALAFRDDAHDASILLNAHCGQRDDDVPLVALTNHLVAGTTERSVDLQEIVPFDGREALHTTMQAKLDGVRRAFDLYVLKKDACVYDFVYVAAPERAVQGVPEFHRFARGFRTAPPEGAP